MNTTELYTQWLEKATADPDLQAELQAIAGQDEEIRDRFYRSLEFGTAGLRGVIGAGTNRMNVYTVGRATQGLADYLNAKYDHPSVAIGYDSRIKSDLFSKEAAAVLAGNGIKVYLYEELEPTPCLSFAVRQLGAQSGIILTASHNPAKYNGYKCYNKNGYQMTDDEAAETYHYIEKVDYGTGNTPVRAILDRIGVPPVYVVPEQELPDGNFPTCPYPNPEIKQAFELALKMNENIHADLLLATDPDCDRVGIAVMQGGKVRLMSGNEVGAMLLNYLLEMRKQKGTLSQNSVAVKSFVSTDLAQAIAARYGCTFKNLLTGFKYIGEVVTQLESQGRADDFVMGFEESYGYLAGTHARDKDAVVASMLICEMAAYYKLQGLSLGDVMDKIYADYGYYDNAVVSYTFEGEAGMEKMAGIMNHLRQNPPKSLGDSPVVEHSDYQSSLSTDLVSGKSTPIDLPKSNVLEYKAENGCKLIVRPSGTEPKIKTYVTAVAADKAVAQKMGQQLIDESAAWMA